MESKGPPMSMDAGWLVGSARGVCGIVAYFTGVVNTKNQQLIGWKMFIQLAQETG